MSGPADSALDHRESSGSAVSLSAQTRAAVENARDRYPHPRSAILPSLWAVQHQFGYLPAAAMAEVAAILGLASSEVQAVSTFYSMYFSRPAGRHQILVCVNVACALRGADDTVAYLEEKLGCPSGSTTADGMFTWQSTIECLGGCGGAPMMQIDHHFHENLTTERIDAILERVAAEAPVRLDGHAAPAAVPHQPTAETPPPSEAEGPPSATGTMPRRRGRRPRGGGSPA